MKRYKKIISLCVSLSLTVSLPVSVSAAEPVLALHAGAEELVGSGLRPAGEIWQFGTGVALEAPGQSGTGQTDTGGSGAPGAGGNSTYPGGSAVPGAGGNSTYPGDSGAPGTGGNSTYPGGSGAPGAGGNSTYPGGSGAPGTGGSSTYSGGSGAPGAGGNSTYPGGSGAPGAGGSSTYPGGGAVPGASGTGTSSDDGVAPGASGAGVTTGSAGPGAGSAVTGGGSTPSSENGWSAGAAGTSGGANTAALKQPEIKAQGAVLMDAASGRLLYQKNAETHYYPASITKLMTALLVAERCSLDEVVTFSKSATTNLESGSVSLNLMEGDQLTVSQCLYGLLLKSANEVANGLAEHVAGSVDAFAALMNERAAAIGCTNTHFVNPNGLNNSNHYTTPHDMALIAREAFKNPVVSQVASTLTYDFPATKKAGARKLTMGHKMLNPADSRYYPGIIGGKTGYTSLAGNTLVTCVERNGVRLIAVVMKSSSTQYTDTAALLDYGYENLQALGLAGSLRGWIQENTGWYYIGEDGNRAANEWKLIDGEYYWFDSDGRMATGWRSYSDGSWYYFRSNGAMAKDCWKQNGTGDWFYLGPDGAMLKNTTVPGGYQVDAEGRWIQ